MEDFQYKERDLARFVVSAVWITKSGIEAFFDKRDEFERNKIENCANLREGAEEVRDREKLKIV